MSEDSVGPWVVVVGMHRSGTSAVTGAVAALGFNSVSAEDRLSPHDSNPEHWESRSILLHNDAILAHFGGTWDAPPQLTERGGKPRADCPTVQQRRSRWPLPIPHPGPAVWKDPRSCLLLPYWRESAPRSDGRRAGVAGPPRRGPLFATAGRYAPSLWRRSVGAVQPIGHCQSRQADVYVLDYDAMIEDPATSLSGLTSWLSSTGTFDGMQPWDHERALAVVTADLRHESTRAADDDDHIVLDEQRRLVAHLTELAGGHRALSPPPGDESQWTEAILDVGAPANVLELRTLERRLEHSDAGTRLVRLGTGRVRAPRWPAWRTRGRISPA